MIGPEKRLADLEAIVARLTREIGRLNALNANPRLPRQGSWICKPDGDIGKGDTDTVSIYAGEVNTTIDVEAKALGAAVESGLWAIAWIDRAGIWYVAPWECS